MPGRPTRSEPGLVLRLGEGVSVAAVEKALAEFPDFTTEPDVAHIDLSDALEFDVVGLLILFSVIATRRENNGRTELRLPIDQPARHILRLWQFPRAAAVAAGVPFRTLVSAADLPYFGEALTPLRVHEEARGPRASVLAHLVERQHFGLSAYRSSGDLGLAQMVDVEPARWRSYAVTRLLEKVLLGPVSDVARVLVQELVTNAVEHPRSAMAIVGSQMTLVKRTSTDTPAGLTISAWDDGASIVDTLRECLLAGGSVRRAAPGRPDEFVVEARGWTPPSVSYWSDWTPTSGSSEPELLLSSLFPGITRKASNQPDPGGDDPSVNAGYGLFSLYKTALDAFQGSVELRSDRTTLLLDRAPGQPRYRVRVTMHHSGPRLSGGIVTVRLPIRDA